MVTQSLLNQYRREVESASNDAKNYVKAITEAYRIAYPEASVADIRNYTLDAINNAVNVFGGQSMLVANDFFEQIAKNEGVDVETDFYSTFDFDTASSKVHYLAQEIVNGDIETFNGKVQDLTAFYVKREAFCNLAKNYMKNGLRYARVPSGRETCAFCFMLCSRGFVYWTEEKARGEGHKYHSNCDCIIVPGFHKDTGIDEDAQIEGYCPSKLRERYKKCYDAINPNGTWEKVYEQWKKSDTQGTWEKFKTKALVNEIGTRDLKWLWSGKNPAIDYSEKARNALTKNEKDAVDWLSGNGIRVRTKIEDPTAKKNIDFEIYGKLYEHKKITNLSSVSNQLGRSRKKFYLLGINEMRHVFTLNDKTCSEEEILNKLRERIKDNEEMLVVFKDGLIRIKK